MNDPLEISQAVINSHSKTDTKVQINSVVASGNPSSFLKNFGHLY